MISDREPREEWKMRELSFTELTVFVARPERYRNRHRGYRVA
jgi:hypothetical protein